MPIDGINGNKNAGSVLFLATRSHHSNGNNGKVVSKRDQDDVQISDRTEEFLHIRRLVDAQPDVRLERVNRLAKAIDEGTYNVKGEQIAEAIIEKHLIDLEG